MKFLTLIGITVLCLVSIAMAEQAYQVAWTAQLGTTGHDYGHGMAIDSGGNIYLSGNTQGDLAAPVVGSYDAYVSKFDASGTPLWTSQIGAGAGPAGESTRVASIVSRYSRILRSGGTHSSWCIAAIGGCETPSPRTNRPSESSANVCRFCAATTASCE